MSVTQRALDQLVSILTAAAQPAEVVVARPGAPAPPDRPPALVTPLSLQRIGRSRRSGSLLDLELAVAVEVAGADVLSLTERLLSAAEAAPHLRIEPLPPERPGFGFVVALGAGVPIIEPSGPPVREPIVHVHSLLTLTGTVIGPDGAAVPGVAVASSLTRQQTTTDAAGGFSLPGLSRPTVLTVSRGSRRATVDVPADTTALRVVLPTHEGS